MLIFETATLARASVPEILARLGASVHERLVALELGRLIDGRRETKSAVAEEVAELDRNDLVAVVGPEIAREDLVDGAEIGPDRRGQREHEFCSGTIHDHPT
jgi:hypothetical protein